MAEALSRELSYETLLNRASRVPTELSVKIALGMSGPEPVRMSTVGSVQMSLDVLIQTQPDLSAAGSADIERYAGDVITSFQARQTATYSQHLDATKAEAQRAETARAADDARNKALREAAERRAEKAESDKDEQATQTAAEKARGDRLFRTSVAVLVVTVAAAVLLALALTATVSGRPAVVPGWLAILRWSPATEMAVAPMDDFDEIAYQLTSPDWDDGRAGLRVTPATLSASIRDVFRDAGLVDVVLSGTVTGLRCRRKIVTFEVAETLAGEPSPLAVIPAVAFGTQLAPAGRLRQGSTVLVTGHLEWRPSWGAAARGLWAHRGAGRHLRRSRHP